MRGTDSPPRPLRPDGMPAKSSVNKRPCPPRVCKLIGQSRRKRQWWHKSVACIYLEVPSSRRLPHSCDRRDLLSHHLPPRLHCCSCLSICLVPMHLLQRGAIRPDFKDMPVRRRVPTAAPGRPSQTCFTGNSRVPRPESLVVRGQTFGQPVLNMSGLSRYMFDMQSN